MKEYWAPTLSEEGGDSVITVTEDSLRIDMHSCPSKGFLIANGLKQYRDYCDHCMGWISPVMQEAGFRIDTEHNHLGQCWWEMRSADSDKPHSAPGEVAGKHDIRFVSSWNEGKHEFYAMNPRGPFGHTAHPYRKTMKATKPYFCTALVTPMQEDDSLHHEGLEAAINQQFDAGVDSLLIGGTMGAMQLLTDQTYRDVMTESVRLANGRGDILAGAGDASFSRTRDRIEFLNTLDVQGVVVLAPYLMPFSQSELLEYYRQLADISKAPLFLYDLPVMTRTKLALDTVLRLAEHPNIAGVKCSDEPGYARQVRDAAGEDFRVILAQPVMMDIFLRDGFLEHLDGVFCLCPRQVVEIGRAVTAGDNARAAEMQQGINNLFHVLRTDEIWRPFKTLLNELGIPGRIKPRPHRDYDEAEAQKFLAREDTQKALAFLRSLEPAAV